MIGRPPISTLFPYPTLSRSPRRRCRLWEPPKHSRRAVWREKQQVIPRALKEPVGFKPSSLDVQSLHAPPVHKRLMRPTAPQDRKSTRLNSSHSQISYAVFCL